MRAARGDPVWRCAEHLDHLALVMAPLPARQPKAHPLAGQGALHKHGLAVDMSDTATVVTQVANLGLNGLLGKRFFLAQRNTKTSWV
jgi:hypothetical protein